MITEKLMALGSWTVTLDPDRTPPNALSNPIKYFGHISIIPQRVDPRTFSDAQLKAMARYTGIVRKIDWQDRRKTISGPGLLAWLGDENGRGYLYEYQRTYQGQSFANALHRSTGISAADADRRDIRPAPPGILRHDGISGSAGASGTVIGLNEGVTDGTVTDTFDAQVFLQTPRSALITVMDNFDTEFRVNADGTIDCGYEATLFTTTPTTVIVREGWGDDPNYNGVPALQTRLNTDTKDWASVAVVSRQYEGTQVALARADGFSFAGKPIEATDYLNAAYERVVYINEPNAKTPEAATNLATKWFTELSEISTATTLTAADYNIEGNFDVGDSVMVYDPQTDNVNLNNEVPYRGRIIYPKNARVTGMTWPITDEMGVYYRTGAGVWTDITDWIVPDTGNTTIEINYVNQNLLRAGRPAPLLSGGFVADKNDVPSVPTGLSVTTGAYEYDDAAGTARTAAWIEVTWTEPTTNADGSTLNDLHHYDVRWRPGNDDLLGPFEGGFPSGFGDSQGYALYAAFTGSTWEYSTVAAGSPVFLIEGLPIDTFYEVAVRAVDVDGNYSAWNDTTIRSAKDTIPPSQPRAPTLTTLPVGIVVSSTLGVEGSGHTYNLELDLDHLRVFMSNTSGFTVGDSTYVGDIIANAGHIEARVRASNTFSTALTGTVYVKITAVDRHGNESTASPQASIVPGWVTIDQMVPDLISIQVIKNISSAQGGEVILADDNTDTWVTPTVGNRYALVPVNSEGEIYDISPRFQADTLWEFSANTNPVTRDRWVAVQFTDDRVIAARVYAIAMSAGAIKADHIRAKSITADKLASTSLYLGPLGTEAQDPDTGDTVAALQLYGDLTTPTGGLKVKVADREQYEWTDPITGETETRWRYVPGTSGVWIENLTADTITSGEFTLTEPGRGGVSFIESSSWAKQDPVKIGTRDQEGFHLNWDGTLWLSNMVATGTILGGNTVIGSLPGSATVHGINLDFDNPTENFWIYDTGNNRTHFKASGQGQSIEMDSTTGVTIKGKVTLDPDSVIGGNMTVPNLATLYMPDSTSPNRIEIRGGGSPFINFYSNLGYDNHHGAIRMWVGGSEVLRIRPVVNSGGVKTSELQVKSGYGKLMADGGSLGGWMMSTVGRFNTNSETRLDIRRSLGPSLDAGLQFITAGGADLPILFSHLGGLPNSGTQILVEADDTLTTNGWFMKSLVRGDNGAVRALDRQWRWGVHYEGYMFIADVRYGQPPTPPASLVGGGMYLFSENGVLKYKDDEGTVWKITASVE